MDELTKYANNIIENPLEYLNTYQSRVSFAKDYLRLQKRVEELERKLGYLEPMSKYWEKDEAKKQLELDQVQKRVEELNGEVKKWQDICTLSDDRAIVCIGNERALRTSMNEAVKEIRELPPVFVEISEWDSEPAWLQREVDSILRKHGLVKDK